jgi:short-subunit dehydrogenase
MSFKDSYGPWALIAGASQGIGRAFAHKVAAEGLNCVLVARREAPLEELAEEIRSQHGVDCLVLAADLSSDSGVDRVLDAVATREIGLFINNAGADTLGERFLEAPVDDWLSLANLNIGTTVRICHRLGREMKERSRGGIVLVGSGACYGASAFTSVYSGAKAFELCFAQGLWAELGKHGVNVLFCALGPTDTPTFRDLLERKNAPALQGLAAPGDVAEKVLAKLPEGPVFNWGQEDDAPGFLSMSASDLRKRVLMVGEGSKRIFGES